MTPRHRDLMLTGVMLLILVTPAWFLPRSISIPWQIGVVVIGIPALFLSWTHAPWQPTPAAELERVVKHLDLAGDQHFCDLGAGDGRLVVAIRRATGADCTGVEGSPLPWIAGRLRLALTGDDRTHLRFGDLYAVDLSDFDAVYVWGTTYSVGTERFGALVRTMKPGARLVSYHQPVHGLEPSLVDHAGQRPIFVYLSPE